MLCSFFLFDMNSTKTTTTTRREDSLDVNIFSSNFRHIVFSFYESATVTSTSTPGSILKERQI